MVYKDEPAQLSIEMEDWLRDNPEGGFTAYDFASAQEEMAAQISWDLIVFEEANVLSTGYQEENKQARILDRIAGPAFRLLLTATPFEKNIMDLYGLIWFIDKSVLPEPEGSLPLFPRRR